MSKIKEHYQNQSLEMDAHHDIDYDMDYHRYLADRAKEFGINTGSSPLSQEVITAISNAIAEEDKIIKDLSEKHEFFQVFERTGTYPC